MSKGKAIVLAVFTAWPLLYVFMFFCLIFAIMVSGFSDANRQSGPPAIFWIIFPLHFFTMCEIAVLLVIYIRHVFKTDRVPQDKKALWAVVLFLGNMIAMPIYWYLYIWREERPPHATPPTTSGP
ncbi:MAG: hypothetical protein K8T91_22510 [Planctomycetes bacterium]|nr:hypothetical protein [Planctomycetota bacterium]